MNTKCDCVACSSIWSSSFSYAATPVFSGCWRTGPVEFNVNRESQQEYFGINNKSAYRLPGGEPVFWNNNMNDDNRFNNNNDHNARAVQAQLTAQEGLQRASQQGLLGRQQMDPCYICRQKEEDLKKQLEGLTNELASEKQLIKDYKLDVLQLKLEVAQLRLALAKAEK